MQSVLTECAYPEIVAWAPELAQIRREIHRHPELGFDTHRTAQRIAGLLRQWGVQTVDLDSVPGGVIAVIEGSGPGKTVALRADIDALPMQDCSVNEWKSQETGRAHACGHDGHQTWLLGALRYLSAKRDFPGRVLAIFQPAEELAKGARAVIDAGILSRYAVAEIYGAHTEPLLPKGVFGFRVGPLQAASDTFCMTLHGVGTHGGRPHLGVDPIPVGAQIVSALQTIVARKVNPIDTAVVSVCSMNAGRFETPNVIPHVLTMSGTVRTFVPEVRDRVQEALEKMCQGIAQANGCTLELVYDRLIAPVINAREQTQAATALAVGLFGAEHVVPDMDPMMSSEDFSEYQQDIPGVIVRIGIRDAEHTVSLHNQSFDFNDEVLAAAATFIAATAQARLKALAA